MRVALRSAGALVAAAACASAPVQKPAPYQTAARTETPPTLPKASALDLVTDAGTSAPTSPPPMAPAPPSMVGMPSTRINVVGRGDDISAVISQMATQVGLRAIIDPAVRGPVNRTLQNVSLTEAMQSLVGNQYQYQVQNGTLTVSPISLEQHTYTLDYLAMSRYSTGSTVVNRGTAGSTSSNSSVIVNPGGQGTGVSSGAGGLTASGADIIQSSSSVDVWGDLTQQLESILFAGTDSTTRNFGGAASSGARPYTRCAANGTCLRISPQTSLIDVTATPEKHAEVSRYVALFTAAITRQVSIKAEVVEVGLDRSNTIGVDWQSVLNTAKAQIGVASTTSSGAIFPTDMTQNITTTGTASFNIGIGDFSIRAVLTALQSVGDVTVVATPRTNALNQQRALFNVTREEQFFSTTQTPLFNATGQVTGYTPTPAIQTVTTGLVFDVLPQISDKNIVTMAIRPSVTSLVSHTVVTGTNGTIVADLPVTDHRETDTMARVRSGETIMIGGLIQKQTSTSRTGVPILMSLPGIGRLFSKTVVSERNTELVIFLTPEIVSSQPPGAR